MIVLRRFATSVQLNRCLAAPQNISVNSKQTYCDDGRFEKLSKQQYWKSRYQTSTAPFDWFLSDEVISSFVCHTLLNVASREDFQEQSKNKLRRVQPVKVLDLGCGHSALPRYFYEWTPFPVAIHCLDFIHEAVEFQVKNLKSTYSGHPSSYACGVCANVCQLPYKQDLFHLVTDKGTMDAVLKDSVRGVEQAEVMLREVERVLKKGGSFMQVTDEDPDSRMQFLEAHSPSSCSWQFSILTDSNNNDRDYFVYTFYK